MDYQIFYIIYKNVNYLFLLLNLQNNLYILLMVLVTILRVLAITTHQLPEVHHSLVIPGLEVDVFLMNTRN